MNVYLRKSGSFVIVNLIICLVSYGQNPLLERGSPYFVNYDKEEYGARYDNWSVLQGDNGLMYFGNGKGVLEYDGVSWRLIQLPNRGVARSLASDSKGRIFVGGFAELGYLEPDATGTLQFISLKDQLK